ncbi:hypothetical protein AC094_30360 [Bacteroides fragilis]|uniref:Transmembrane protein n=1 Tax=Bacteroides fragilis TaxID=817 RepID=A0A853PSS7_BACFG|nr:putative transcriptional regulator [Bacteroides fragilis str. J38-1]EYA37940.1 putative transcriptional regulator [Bacteroides fragilis str. 20793-3]OCR29961.1 hypothetical protein AC094_30360 [Bacteroides fragilis]
MGERIYLKVIAAQRYDSFRKEVYNKQIKLCCLLSVSLTFLNTHVCRLGGQKYVLNISCVCPFLLSFVSFFLSLLFPVPYLCRDDPKNNIFVVYAIIQSHKAHSGTRSLCPALLGVERRCACTGIRTDAARGVRPNGLSPGAPTVFADRRPVATLFFHQRAGVRLFRCRVYGDAGDDRSRFSAFCRKSFSPYACQRVSWDECKYRRDGRSSVG